MYCIYLNASVFVSSVIFGVSILDLVVYPSLFFFVSFEEQVMIEDCHVYLCVDVIVVSEGHRGV